ncbi:NrdH-redoxin [Bacillus cereus]|nr:NrdH-redoxin [Bacillus cereus]
MATKIIVYTGNTCSKCKRAKEMLRSCPVDVEIEERNIDDIDKGGLYVEELRQMGSMVLPTLIIKEDEYFGFDENIGKIMEALGL